MDKKFTILQDDFVIATHIASLLNRHNKLRVIHTGQSILYSNIEYIIEQRILNNQIIVAGCVGINRLNKDAMFLKHLCIHEHFRGSGIASNLIKNALKKEISTTFAFMDIRSDNFPSLSLAEKEGFLIINRKYLTNYNVLTVGKINDATKTTY